jgi:hypothetical protein
VYAVVSASQLTFADYLPSNPAEWFLCADMTVKPGLTIHSGASVGILGDKRLTRSREIQCQKYSGAINLNRANYCFALVA